MIALRIVAWLAFVYFGGVYLLSVRAWLRWARSEPCYLFSEPTVHGWALFIALAGAAIGVFA